MDWWFLVVAWILRGKKCPQSGFHPQFACQRPGPQLARASDNAYILGNPATKVKETLDASSVPTADVRQKTCRNSAGAAISAGCPRNFPMILSMTGFAAVAAELPGVSLAVELRSVNHRYLDLSIRLPDELRAAESSLREILAAAVKRGKVECRIALNRTAQGTATLAVDSVRIGQLAAAASEVTRAVPAAAPLSVHEILRWPGVLGE